VPPEVEEQPEEQPDAEETRLEELIGGLETRIVERLEGTLSQRLESRFDSIADRRVNALLNEIRKPKESEGQPPPPMLASNDRVRRATLKSAIQSELVMRDLTNDERRIAQEMAFSTADYRVLGDGEDEFVLAKSIVDGAVKTLHGARDTYQEQLRDELKSRGVPMDDEEKQPGRKPKPKAQNDMQQFDKGAERAKAFANPA
jgi:hypothetical protein